MTNPDGARRIVLLARPGAARDRMREALAQAGANIALEADPTATDQAAVLQARPDVALIVLDAATDEALERFDGLLSDPKVEVFFEEAELAVGRVGWDAARWVRHLSAKLRHSNDVLPPGRDPSRDASSAVAVAPIAVEAVAPMPTVSLSERIDAAVPPPLPELADIAVAEIAVPRLSELADISSVDSSSADSSLADGARPEIAVPPPLPDFVGIAVPPPLPDLADITAGEREVPGANDTVAPFNLHTDMELVAIELGDEAAHYASSHASEPASSIFGKLELEPVDDTPTEIKIEGLELEADHPADASRFQNDMADLQNRMAAMELVADAPLVRVRGAVLVLAGIGGPDAVRQLLGALPETFPRPVLVQQRLDGGHYDKLVAQMQRATTMPVKLAAFGDALQPATVYILPPSHGVQDSPEGMTFTDNAAELLTSLPAGDSAVLMLSGSDPALVDTVMKLAAAGALIAGQALDGCYDVAAPAALVSRGGVAGKPQDLARRLAERWH